MTAKERILSAINRERLDRISCDYWMAIILKEGSGKLCI